MSSDFIFVKKLLLLGVLRILTCVSHGITPDHTDTLCGTRSWYDHGRCRDLCLLHSKDQVTTGIHPVVNTLSPCHLLDLKGGKKPTTYPSSTCRMGSLGTNLHAGETDETGVCRRACDEQLTWWVAQSRFFVTLTHVCATLTSHPYTCACLYTYSFPIYNVLRYA